MAISEHQSFINLDDRDAQPGGIGPSHEISTSVEDFTDLNNSNLFDDLPWTVEPSAGDDVFANPRLQHINRRSISEPPMFQTEFIPERPVVFHRELHAARKSRTRPYRRRPYARHDRRSPRLVTLGEDVNEQQEEPKIRPAWRQAQPTLASFVPISEPKQFYPAQLDSRLHADGQTLSITDRRAIEPVLRITQEELIDIIANTVHRTIAELGKTQRM